jgi:hypothetical protein
MCLRVSLKVEGAVWGTWEVGGVQFIGGALGVERFLLRGYWDRAVI